MLRCAAALQRAVQAGAADRALPRVVYGEAQRSWFRVGPPVFDGYLDAPELNAASFVDGWFRTGDAGVFDADGYLTLTGRIKEMINRGGTKIAPAEIDAALMAHPGIVEAVSFALPHATLGEIVGAAVVVAPRVTVSEQEIARFLRDRLAPIKCPRRIFVVDAIPKGSAGKLQRDRLSAMFADTG